MLHNPPYYRYSLSETWNKKAFLQIKEIAKSKNYPKIFGSEEEINKFLIMLIRTQKSLHNWNDYLADILEQVEKNNIIDTKSLITKYPSSTIGKDKPTWVTYFEDQIVSDFIDELETREIKFIGTNQEISEFILRFILGQLGNDWEQTIMMIWEMLGNDDTLIVKELNAELKNFDYLKLFE